MDKFNDIYDDVILVDGVIYDNKITTLICVAKNITHLTIPNTVTKIEEYAFKDSKIETLIIPDSVTFIGQYAFWRCKNLQNITLSNSIIAIKQFTFYQCHSLTNIIIPDKVNFIEHCSFTECFKLESITLSKNLSYLGRGVFSACNNLKKVNISTENRHFSCSDNILYNKDKTKIIYFFNGRKTINIISSVKSVNDDAFCAIDGYPEPISDYDYFFHNPSELKKIIVENENCYFSSINGILYDKNVNTLIYAPKTKKNVIVPNSVRIITDSSFIYNTNLESIHLSKNLIKIEDSAFWGCINLKSIIIPDNVEDLDMLTFSDCYNLESITLGKKLKYIDHTAFAECKNIKKIIISKENSDFYLVDNKHLTDRYNSKILASINI